MSVDVNGSRTSGGSVRHRKPNFDDVTIDHECVLQAPPSAIRSRTFAGCATSMIVIAKSHPSTRKRFHSTEAVRRETLRHVFSNCWFIIHPFSKLRFYWNSLMAFTFYLLFLHTPFMYAFYRDFEASPITATWCISTGILLNALCLVDIFLNFFTGFETKYGNFIVLHHGSIIQNYLLGSFAFDFLSTLPFDAIHRLSFVAHGNSAISIFCLHLAFLFKFLRFVSVKRMKTDVMLLTMAMKWSYVKCQSILIVAQSIMYIHLCVCVHKAFSSHLVPYVFDDRSTGPYFNEINDLTISMWNKYYEISEYAIWALFDTTFEENEMYFPGKILSSIFMIAGVVYNTCLLIQILNILNIMHAPRTKYHEVMNQLDAYMQKKKFPMHLQLRLKYFFKKKFRRFFYREDEIMEILSEPLQREILINTGQLFVERVELFQNVPKSLVTQIAVSCKKEEFLPNDLIVKAGSVGDCMFFIGSGTVCFATTNGQEIEHLGDGNHFGEIALILQNNKRIVSVTAIEFCEIYILDYAGYKKFLQTNESIMLQLTAKANQRMKIILRAEEEQRQQLSEKIARQSLSN